jgi:hypothetical protein
MRTAMLASLFLNACEEPMDLEADATDLDEADLAWTATTKLTTGYGATHNTTPCSNGLPNCPYHISPASSEHGFWSAQFVGYVPRAPSGSTWKVTKVSYVLVDSTQSSTGALDHCNSGIGHRVRLFTAHASGAPTEPSGGPHILKEWTIPAFPWDATPAWGPRTINLSDRGGISVPVGASVFVAVEMNEAMCQHTRPAQNSLEDSWFSTNDAAPYGWTFLADFGVSDQEYGFEVTLSR